MSIKFEDLLTVFDLNEKKHSQIESILFEYGTLKQKLQNVEAHSWAFKKGLENHKKKLVTLKKAFDSIRSDFNATSLDELIYQLNKENEGLKSYESKSYRGIIDRIAIASFRSKIVYLQLLIDIRSRTDEIKEIDYYFENKEQSIKLLAL